MFAKLRGRARVAALGLALVACNADRLVAPTTPAAAPTTPGSGVARALVSGGDVVISQVFGGGASGGAAYTNDYVELFNRGDTPVVITGWRINYASTGGSSWQAVTLTGTVAPGRYFLIQLGGTTSGAALLPAPDATGGIGMAGAAGKVVLTNAGVALSGACPANPEIVDQVAYGANSDPVAGCGDAWGRTAPVSVTTAAFRKGAGCTKGSGAKPADDFEVLAANPRNSASVPNDCGPVVPPAPVATVVVTPETATLTVSDPFTFSAQGRDADGNTVATTFTWTSSNPAVATVSATGAITALAAGTTTISATSANDVIGSATLTVNAAPPPGDEIPDVVISQVYGGGGNSNAPYNADFVELFNRGDAPAVVGGWKLYYGSASSTGITLNATLPMGATIAPKSYYLVQLAGGSTGAPLPPPDATGSLNLSGASGKVVLVTASAVLSGACPSGAGIVDHVGYGSANCATDWNGQVAALSNGTAALRGNDGCTSTGSASSDFVVDTPAPRNSATAPKDCALVPRPVSSATIVINELLGDPVYAESASWGEWFEVHNYGTTPVDLQGWTILSGGQPSHVVAQSVVVAPGSYAVLGRGWDPMRNGGVTLAYNYFTGGSTIWLDNNDYLALVDASGGKVDSLSWATLPRGISRGLRDRTKPHTNVNGTNWGFATTTFGEGDYGTPGAANEPLSDTAPYVSPNTLSFSGRTASDAPVPVGFEAQAFASLKDASGATIPTAITWSALTPELATIDARGVVHGLAPGYARFRATAADGTTRVLTLAIEAPVASTTAQYLNSTAFGDPVDADPSDDLIIRRPQYTSSFSASRMIPNWVAYDLNATHIAAGQDRCNCFTFDPELEALGLTRYTTADYTGAGSVAGYGIDRGHLARSFDRTTGTLDNARTYYFSNIIPQAADLNQGPWAVMESYLGSLAQADGKEVYIVAGASGSRGTVKDEGRITIPGYTWKVALILPRGGGVGDVHRVDDAQVIAVVMPNVPGVRNVDWNSYRVTVDSVEALSGYDVLSLLDDEIERPLEAGDRHAPVAALDAPATIVTEGGSLAFDASASRDADGDALTYTWTIGGDTVAAGVAPTIRFDEGGTQVLVLTVRDAYGAADRRSVAITVRLALGGSASPQAINANATGNGNVAFALLSRVGASATTLDLATARIGTVAPILKNAGDWFTESRDVNGDGLTDLVMRFDRGELVRSGALAVGQSTLVLRGTMQDGRLVESTAAVAVH